MSRVRRIISNVINSIGLSECLAGDLYWIVGCGEVGKSIIIG